MARRSLSAVVSEELFCWDRHGGVQIYCLGLDAFRLSWIANTVGKHTLVTLPRNAI